MVGKKKIRHSSKHSETSKRAASAQDGTCEASKMMRENTDSEVFFEEYTISDETMARLESLREALKDDIARANPLWKVIAEQDEEELSSKNKDSDSDDTDEPINDSEAQTTHNQTLPLQSTQFYFTQAEIIEEPKRSDIALPQKYDILECVCENLERNNGRLDFVQLESLADEDLVPLVSDLEKKLSLKGVYNLCQSMDDTTVEQRIRYLNIFCTYILLPKIIKLEEPSRLLSSTMVEYAKIFPGEVQQLILVPIFNNELKETSIITSIVNTFDQQRKAIILQEFLEHVKDLKLWHISLLQNFLSVRLDENVIDKIVALLSGKALHYSKDKNFGKLVLSFLKINTKLSEEQKNMMTEIAAINETLFKKAIENILRSI